MSKKFLDSTNLGKMNGIGDDLDGQIVELMDEYEDIFDLLATEGIEPFTINDSNAIKLLKTDENDYGYSYEAYEMGHFGLSGEYNTQTGVKVHTNSIRKIRFNMFGQEDTYQAVEYDPIVDSGKKPMLQSRALNDYAHSRKEQREIKFIEQVANSGLPLTDAASYKTFYDTLGFTNFTAPTNPDLMRPNEFEEFTIAVDEYFKTIGRTDTPVIMVKPAEWANLVKSDNFVSIMDYDNRNKQKIESSYLAMIHNCLIVKFSKLGRPNSIYKDIHRLIFMNGNMHLKEQDLRPVKWRPRVNGSVEGNELIDAEYLSGTYMQFVVCIDNLKTSDGDTILTKLSLVCGSTLVQDPSKIIFGEILGDKPTVKPIVNRTLKSRLQANYDNASSDFSQDPPSGTGEYVDGTAPFDGDENGSHIPPRTGTTPPPAP